MTAAWTGERIIPGQVEADLWNEHFARYVFARRMAANRRVLDAGCGAGYGSAELASVAAHVVGVDLSHEAVSFAGDRYRNDRTTFLQSSVLSLPFADRSFDLIVSFEVIEHLREWDCLLSEAARLLGAGGQFVVSTPNKSFYAETRGEEGPNPWHEHEFEYEEFREALRTHFEHVTIWLEDHSEGVVFRGPAAGQTASAHIEEDEHRPEASSFFIAVCGSTPQPHPEPFVFVPRASNLLAEKMLHIRKLEEWLTDEQANHQELLRQHTALQVELERSNQWAAELGLQLDHRGARIVDLQNELAGEQKAAREAITALNAEVAERTQWAQDTEGRLTSELAAVAADRDRQTAELVRCVEALHSTEAALDERTRWAMQLNEELTEARTQLAAVSASRWMKLGRAVGLGPELHRH